MDQFLPTSVNYKPRANVFPISVKTKCFDRGCTCQSCSSTSRAKQASRKANLEMLPNEILEQIFKRLRSIDDAHHMARTCKRINSVLGLDGVYKRVMGSIIVNSPIHRFDKQLCNLLEVHSNILNFYEANKIFPQCADPATWDSRQDPIPFDLYRATDPGGVFGPSDLHPDEGANDGNRPFWSWDITDSEIFDILARWQGLRELQHLFLRESTRSMSYLNPWTYGNNDPEYSGADIVHHYRTILSTADGYFKEERSEMLPSRSEDMKSFDADQTERFYLALVSIWVLNEHRWCFASLEYGNSRRASSRNREDMLSAFENMLMHGIKQWGEWWERTLLDELDLLEVYEFLYHGLLIGSTQAMNDGCWPHMGFEIFYEDDMDQRLALRSHLKQFMLHVQPPDILELVLLQSRAAPGQKLMPPMFATRTLVDVPRPSAGPDWMFRSLGTLTNIASMGNTGVATPEPLGDMHYLYLSESRVYPAIEKFCRKGLLDPRQKEFHKYWAESLRGGWFWLAQSAGKAECRVDRLRETPEPKICMRCRGHHRVWNNPFLAFER